MGSPLRPASDPPASARQVRSEGEAKAIIDQLEQRFTEFRREHPPQTRIPHVLRSAAVAALREGVTRAQLRRCCGLSSSQIEQWQRAGGRSAAGSDPSTQDARVFAVVDEADRGPAQPEGEGSSDPAQGHELELRLDGWSVSVRRLAR